MLIGALILSYGDGQFLRPVIKQYLRLDKILVMNYLFPQSEPFPDETKSICNELGVEVKSGEGLNQEDVLNLGIQSFAGFHTIFMSDADEFIMRADQDEIIKRQKAQPHNYITLPMIEYAGDLYHKYEERGHKPVCVVTPETRFYDVRCVCGAGRQFNDIYMHHLGFIANEERMAWKRKKQIITNRYDAVEQHMCRKIEPYQPPQELLDLFKC